MISPMKAERMEKTKLKSFSCFGIIILIAWFGEVLSKPPVIRTIVDQMNSDNSLCKEAKFFTSSNFTQACAKLNYVEEMKLDMKTINTFLCLEVYDAAYKYCLYASDSKIKSFKNVEELDTELRKFSPDDHANSTEVFCNSLTGLRPSYERLQEPLLQLANEFNKTTTCPAVCYDIITHKFSNPLCTVVAWINGIDHNNTLSKLSDTAPQYPELKNAISKGTNLLKEETLTSDHPETLYVVSDLSSTRNNLDQSYAEKGKPNEDSANQGNKKFPATNTAGQTQNDIIPSKTNAPEPTPMQLNHIIQLAEAKGSLHNKEKVDNPTNTKESEDDKKEEVKPNRSETIKDPEDINQDDNNHLDDNQDHYDQDDVVEPPIDPEVNQNLPEIQPRYPSIKSEEDSHFFTYFTVISVICIAGYIGYHNKQKILAILLEGRKSRGSRSRRRPSTANYRKLDCTLEEAVTSQCNVNVTHVIY